MRDSFREQHAGFALGEFEGKNGPLAERLVADGIAAGALTWLSGASTPFRSQKMMIIIW